MTALDLSADVGLLAVFLATANICLGLLIAVRYSPRRLWPHRRINIFAIHLLAGGFNFDAPRHPAVLNEYPMAAGGRGLSRVVSGSTGRKYDWRGRIVRGRRSRTHFVFSTPAWTRTMEAVVSPAA